MLNDLKSTCYKLAVSFEHVHNENKLGNVGLAHGHVSLISGLIHEFRVFHRQSSKTFIYNIKLYSTTIFICRSKQDIKHMENTFNDYYLK